MRELLGDGYTEALRQLYKDVPDTVDYVMYWWHKAAELERLNYKDMRIIIAFVLGTIG